MKTGLKYVPLAIASSIVSIIALIGTYVIYLSLSHLTGDSGSYHYSAFTGLTTDSVSTVTMLFFLGIVATAVIAIFLAVYFIYEERKIAIIISCILATIEFILFLRFFDTTISILMSGMSSLLFGESQVVDIMGSIMGSLQFILIVATISTIFNILVLLQMYHVLHLSFLQPYIPDLLCEEVVETLHETVSADHEEGGESS